MGWVPPPPVWTDTQSENITSRHPSDAGGNKIWPPLLAFWGVVTGVSQGAGASIPLCQSPAGVAI